MKGQFDLFSEIIVDNFAGGGGASTGIELATGKIVDIAINHDPDAILMHRTNHPNTEHIQASVWDVDPVEVCRGRPVGLAWFSPDCFVAGTLILTHDGYKPIEDVQVGDYVWTHKNRWKPVVETLQSTKPVMKLRGYGHPGIVCSRKHPFYVCPKNGRDEPAFKTAETIKPGKDYWGIPKMEHSVEGVVSDGEAWVAGRYVGDGWLRVEEKHYETVITCGKQDVDFLRKTLPEKTPGRNWNYRNVRTGGQFTHCDKAFCEWLLRDFGKLSENKRIPLWLLLAEPKIKQAFLEGYVSADGYEKDGLTEIRTVSKKLAFGLVQLLATMGKPATVYYSESNTEMIEGRKVKAKPVWCVKWRDSIDAEHVQHFEKDGIIWRPIREVTDLEREETVYNIGVKDDESYVAEGIIVHNCKHFSKAKGSALVDRNIRGLAWIVLRWAATVHPRVIILENVEEFQTWGPVRKGKPIKSKAGITFKQWKLQLQNLGYNIEHRELIAADYGAPTIRKRFVLIARNDGKPIVWPERTHAPADSEDVKNGKRKPWRSAAEIIDWNLPMYSVFATKAEIKEKYGVNAVRPLADNTLRRVIRGVDKFTIQSGNPFIVPDNRSAQLISYHSEQTESVRANSMDTPMPTIDASNRYGLVVANLTEYFGNGVPIDPREPMRTITSHDREALTVAHICKYYGGVIGADAGEPLPTVTGIDHNALCATHIIEFKGQCRGQNPAMPLLTITQSAGEFALCKSLLVKADETQNYGYWQKIRDLLNKHCGYAIGNDEILLLLINGVAYYIHDILLRMLAPKELYAAMGFPQDYIIDRDYLGHEYGKSKQVARCGNAVCPPMAEAVVRANYEAYEVAIVSMEQLQQIVSA